MSQNEDFARQVVRGFILKGGSMIALMFEGYRKNVMPPGAGPVQVLECKRAFFAGTRSMLDLMMAAADPGLDATDRDLEIMAVIEKELAEWMTDGQMREHTVMAPAEGRA